MLANETEERKQEIWNIVTDQAKQRFVEKDTGRIKLANEAICIVGSSINEAICIVESTINSKKSLKIQLLPRISKLRL